MRPPPHLWHAVLVLPLLISALCAGLLLCGATRVCAQAAAGQNSAAAPPGYREAIDAAVVAFEAHDVEEARSLFARADLLFPNARTQRGLGLAEFELRNYVQAIRYLEAALESQVRRLDGD